MNDKYYMFQNFTVAILYQKLMKFVMYEYQVKWRPNENPLTKNQEPYTIQIDLIKLREIIFKQGKEA